MTRDAASFDKLYKDLGDPWNYETSAYEADKYRRCLALLPAARYRRAVEVGCSIGVMSALIAERCDSLLGLDFAPTAIAAARRRLIANARFEVAAVPQHWPAGPWDLIVLSEVLYYLEPDALDRFIRCVARDLAPGGDCLLVGYRGETETLITPVEAHDRMLSELTLARPSHEIRSIEHPKWAATVFCSREAQAEGAAQGR